MQIFLSQFYMMQMILITNMGYYTALTLAMCADLKEIALVIEAGSLTKEVRRISRAVHLTVA
jgi:hypothetical protein